MAKWGKRKKACHDGSKEKKAKAAAPEVWNTTRIFENTAFDSYYKAQGIVEESEWEEFKRRLVEGLPLAIRINGNMPTWPFLLKQIQSLQCSEATDPIHPHELAWLPGGLAWQWNGIDRRTVKKKSQFKELKQWLTGREKHGAISRQETVSMIPALFLDVQSHHLVMDFCAAPGSKTCQMIELLHRRKSTTGGQEALNWVEGAIFAGDVDSKRANMLAHQVQRLGSPSVGIVNIDAAFFPKLMKDSQQLLFDRVLCDVPCTGDGTVRKQPHIWQSWSVKGGLGLHQRQIGILQRGLELLKVGGKLVYSTCSLNPIENEAVVATFLRRFDNIKLIEPPANISVTSKPSLATWRVPKPDGNGSEFYDNYEEVPEQWRKTVLRTMFPDGSTDHLLGRRFLPHLMNTGGFFCAIFTKTDSVMLRRKNKPEKETQAAGNEATGEARDNGVETKETAVIAPESKSWKPQGSEYAMLREDSEDWEAIQSFYGLHSWAHESIFVNKVGNERKLFAISKGVQQMLQSEARMQLKFITAGVRVLQQIDNVGFACKFRLSQEGLPSMFAFGMSKRVVKATSLNFFHRLLCDREVAIEEAKENCSDWDQICASEKILSGSAVVLMPDGQFQGLAVHVMVSQKNMTLYVDKQEAAALAESVAQSPDLKGIIDAAALRAEAESQAIAPVEAADIEICTEPDNSVAGQAMAPAEAADIEMCTERDNSIAGA